MKRRLRGLWLLDLILLAFVLGLLGGVLLDRAPEADPGQVQKRGLARLLPFLGLAFIANVTYLE